VWAAGVALVLALLLLLLAKRRRREPRTVGRHAA
jgi:hypothetical protein